MNSQAGKGDKIRPGANLKAYWDNYDNIFRKEPEDDIQAIMWKNYVRESTKDDDLRMIEIIKDTLEKIKNDE
jgi:hypothetical protein